jgi:guanine deaminase
VTDGVAVRDGAAVTMPRAVIGTALHAPRRGGVEALRDVVIVIDADGTIEGIHAHASPAGRAAAARHAASGTLTVLKTGCVLLPGMIDLHVHAPQWPQLGLALDEPLEVWLQKFTFPLEARYADTAYAASVYESLVDTLLANGTTTALYYGSIHLAATQALAAICLERSQRALIGRVAMDNPEQCPDYYRDTSAASAEADTRAFIEYVRAMPGNRGLIWPVITPRFIPSCTDDLLQRLGALALETACHVQTHCSESDWAQRVVRERCGVSDTTALAGYGLLSRRTVLAHANFVDDADTARIVDAGAGIAHCPLSNAYLSDAVFPLRRLLQRGAHVGLGTDIAGGASPSLLENARQAVIVSRLLESGVDAALDREQRRREPSRIDALTAFWLATTGGGIALDLPIGLFKTGYQFDAIVIEASTAGNLRIAVTDSESDIVQKIIYHASRADIRDVWVAGRCVRRRSCDAHA